MTFVRQRVREVLAVLQYLPGLVASAVAWAVSLPHRVLTQDRGSWHAPNLEERMEQAVHKAGAAIDRARATPSANAR